MRLRFSSEVPSWADERSHGIASGENGAERACSRSRRCSALCLLAAASAERRADRRPGSSTRPAKIVPLPGLDPPRRRRHGRQAHRRRPALDRRPLPDLRHRRLLRAAAQRRTRRLQPVPRQATPTTTTASRSTSCRSNGRAANATPTGRRSPASPNGPSRCRTSRCRPSAGSATTATPATAAATISTSPGSTPAARVPARRMGRSLPHRPRQPAASRASRVRNRRRRNSPAVLPAASAHSTPAASPPAATDRIDLAPGDRLTHASGGKSIAWSNCASGRACRSAALSPALAIAWAWSQDGFSWSSVTSNEVTFSQVTMAETAELHPTFPPGDSAALQRDALPLYPAVALTTTSS